MNAFTLDQITREFADVVEHPSDWNQGQFYGFILAHRDAGIITSEEFSFWYGKLVSVTQAVKRSSAVLDESSGGRN